MKTIRILILCVIILSGFYSCKTDYLFFDEDFSSTRFTYVGLSNDTLTYSFALNPEKQEDIISIPIQIIGFTKSYNRNVKIYIDELATTATNGTDFDIKPCVVDKNSITSNIELVLKRTTHLNNGDLKISIELGENEHFMSPPTKGSKFHIVITEKLSKPSDWPFEPYSLKKHEFVIEVIGKGSGFAAWSGQERIFYLGLLNKALYEYNKNHPGSPLVDENNIPITF